MTASTKGRWFVVCDDYELGPYTSEVTAQRHLASVLRLGACGSVHRIEDRTVSLAK